MKKILIGLLILLAAGIYLFYTDLFDLNIRVAIFFVACLAFAAHIEICVQEIEVDKEKRTKEFLQQGPPHWMKVLNRGKKYKLSSRFKTSNMQKEAGTAVEQETPFNIMVFEVDGLMTKIGLDVGDEFILSKDWTINKIVPKVEAKE